MSLASDGEDGNGLQLEQLRLVYASDGMAEAKSESEAEGTLRAVVCKSKNGVVSGIGSATQSKGSGGFVFLLTPLLLQSLMIVCKPVKRIRKHKRKNQPITELIPCH